MPLPFGGAFLPLIGAGILILLLTWAAAAVFKRTGERFLPRKRLRASLRELLLRLAMIAIWVAGIFLAMTVVFPDITPGRALATLGLGSIAIGFAFKDIFENFFAGVLILWRFPFDPGDYIECEGIMGQVQDVTIRNTLIRKTTGELVVIPNATIFKSPVHVLTNLNRRRVTVICGVAYDEDVDESRRVITEAVAACETVLKDQPIQIFAQEFAESSINFEVTWWTGPLPVDTRLSKDEVVAAVKRALDNAGIEIPFPYRTLTFKGPVETRTIEEHDGRCPRTEPACARFLKEAALAFASGSSVSGRVETAVSSGRNRPRALQTRILSTERSSRLVLGRTGSLPIGEFRDFPARISAGKNSGCPGSPNGPLNLKVGADLFLLLRKDLHIHFFIHRQ